MTDDTLGHCQISKHTVSRKQHPAVPRGESKSKGVDEGQRGSHAAILERAGNSLSIKFRHPEPPLAQLGSAVRPQLAFVQQIGDDEHDWKIEYCLQERTAGQVRQHGSIGDGETGFVVFGLQSIGCLLLLWGLLHPLVQVAYGHTQQFRSLRFGDHVLGQRTRAEAFKA